MFPIMWQYFREAPPIARALAAMAFTLSLLVYTKALSYHHFCYIPPAFLQLPPELWRLFTPFFLTDPNIGILVDTYFLYTYGAKLEIASPRFLQRADFITYLCFICFAILGLNIVIGGTALASPLALAFITTSTLDSWNIPISFFGFVSIPAQYLPYLLLLIALVCQGPRSALSEGTGLVAAHGYNFLTGLYSTHGGPSKNLLPTPEFLRKVFGTRVEVVRPYGTVLNANAPSGTALDGIGASAWGVGWGKWGKGHRLGGDAEAGAPMQRGRGRLVSVLVVIGCVVIALGLGVVVMMHRDPEGWWTTLRKVIFGGDIQSATQDLSSSKGSVT